MVIFPTANITEIFYIKLKDVDNQLIWLYDKEDALNDFHKAVNDVFNAICVTGNMLGDVMFYGKGAGKEATASAVVSDVVDAVKHMNINVMTIWEDEKLPVAPMDEMKNRFFVRIGAEEKERAIRAFDEIEAVDAGIDGEYGFVTGVMTEGEFNDTMAEFETFITRIRVGFWISNMNITIWKKRMDPMLRHGDILF